MNDTNPNKPHERCGARNRSGGTCAQPAGWGTDHVGAGLCKLHGGSSPGGKIHAGKILAERAVVTFGLPRDVDPATALLEEVARTAGHVDWLGQVVAGLDEKAVVFGVAEVRRDGEGTSTVAKAAPNVWLELYRSERKHLVEVCRAAITCGVAERQVRLAEQQGSLLAEVLRGVLGELGVLDRPETAGVVRRHLSAMAAIETSVSR